MKHKNYLVFDFETGGLDPRKNAATEIGCMFIDGETLESKETYQSLFKPFSSELTYEEGAFKVTGLNLDILNQGGRDIKLIVSELEDYILRNTPYKEQKYKPVLVGHNVQFDIGFLSQIFLFCKKDLSKLISTSKDIYGSQYPSFIDTIELTGLSLGNKEDLKNWKLTTICEYIGIELNDAHRAMNDVYSTAELFKYYTKKLRSSQETVNSEVDTSRFRNRFQIKITE